MSTATQPPRSQAPPAPPKAVPYTMRVTLEPDVYDALLAAARREFRRPEWQASYVLARAIRAQMEGAADAA